MTAPTVLELLDFEAAHADWPRGRKEAAAREQFGVAPIRYYQLLRHAVTTVDAAQHDPITTRRVIDQMARRLQSRQERTR